MGLSPSALDERDHVTGSPGDRAARLACRGANAGIVDQDDLALGSQSVGERRIPVVEVAAEMLQHHERLNRRTAETTVHEPYPASFDDLRRCRVVARRCIHGQEPVAVIESRMIEAYSAGASSQTK